MSLAARQPSQALVFAGLAALIAASAPASALAKSFTHLANVALETAYPFLGVQYAEGASDGWCSYSNGAVFDNGTIHYPSIKLFDFKFDIPAESTITSVAVNAKAATVGATNTQGLHVRLLWGATHHTYTYNLAVEGSGSSNSVACTDAEYHTFLRANWGHVFTVAEVNSSDFGVELTDNTGGNSVYLDSVQIKINYLPPDLIFANGFETPPPAGSTGLPNAAGKR